MFFRIYAKMSETNFDVSTPSVGTIPPLVENSSNGGPARTRTENQSIMSALL
jgi:hypothetical protein